MALLKNERGKPSLQTTYAVEAKEEQPKIDKGFKSLRIRAEQNPSYVVLHSPTILGIKVGFGASIGVALFTLVLAPIIFCMLLILGVAGVGLF